MKIHFFAYSCEHQNFITIGLVGISVTRSEKLILILIDFLIPLVIQGFDNRLIMRFETGFNGACLLRRLFNLL